MCVSIIHTQRQCTCLWKFPYNGETEVDSLGEEKDLIQSICLTYMSVQAQAHVHTHTTFIKKTFKIILPAAK